MEEKSTCSFDNGMMVIDKLREMGFEKREMPHTTIYQCKECNNEFEMTHLETKCPQCGMVYGVTPCSTSDPDKIMAAGINY